MNITHRVGTSPEQRGSASGANCPDVLKLDTGDYLIIGKIPTEAHLLDDLHQHGASIGPDELALILPADALHAAVLDIAGRALPTSRARSASRAILRGRVAHRVQSSQTHPWRRRRFNSGPASPAPTWTRGGRSRSSGILDVARSSAIGKPWHPRSVGSHSRAGHRQHDTPGCPAAEHRAANLVHRPAPTGHKGTSLGLRAHSSARPVVVAGRALAIFCHPGPSSAPSGNSLA